MKIFAMMCPIVLLAACAQSTTEPGFTETENASPVQDAGQIPGDAQADSRSASAVDAALDAADAREEAAVVCLPTLADIGRGDFTVDFKLTTSTSARTTIVYQRSACARGMFWDVRINYGGVLRVELDDGTAYTVFDSVHVVNDGAEHRVRLRRANSVLSLAIDGVLEGAANAGASIGALPTLGSKSGDPCEGLDETVPLVGTLTNVCITAP